jgi:predicted nucleic acid-binding protein
MKPWRSAKAMYLVLDSGVLGRLCHPNARSNREVAEWLGRFVAEQEEPVTVCIPQISDYELRRKLLHLIGKSQATATSIRRLDDFIARSLFLPLDIPTMKHAAQLWADARLAGRPTAGPGSLDGDVILAAQALQVDGIVATENARHLGRYVRTCNWTTT